MPEARLDFSTVLKGSDETMVEVVDMFFDLGCGHRANNIELTWALWKRLRRMIPAAEKVGPLSKYKEDEGEDTEWDNIIPPKPQQ